MHRASAGPARIILDANILVSAVIASGRASGSALGHTVDRVLGGDARVIACPRLLTEVERALRSPRLGRWVAADQVVGAMEWIVGGARVVSDPETVVRCAAIRPMTTWWRSPAARWPRSSRATATCSCWCGCRRGTGWPDNTCARCQHDRHLVDK